ncbi:MAG TPA: class I SAM-dependent methyltransferase [Aliidongia sp.]|nr:class I SAM-dependent methyltransferase [Aliidongia sp.]
MTHADPLAVPTQWVRRWAHLVPAKGPVLDLASGGGRHARFFAGRGHPVTAVDIRLDAMADLAGDGRFELVQADLETAPWPLGGRRFAGIVVVNYLHRPLWPHLIDSLDEGGVLIYETFAQGQADFGRPSNPDFLLAPNELVERVGPDLTIVAYEHGVDHTPNPAARQRVAAVRGRALSPL